jgi:hypothetical protein
MDQDFSKPFEINEEKETPVDFFNSAPADSKQGLVIGKMILDHADKSVEMKLGHCPFVLEKGIEPEFKQQLMALDLTPDRPKQTLLLESVQNTFVASPDYESISF